MSLETGIDPVARLFRSTGRFGKRSQSAKELQQVIAFSYDEDKHNEGKLLDDAKITEEEAEQLARSMERTTMSVRRHETTTPIPNAKRDKTPEEIAAAIINQTSVVSSVASPPSGSHSNSVVRSPASSGTNIASTFVPPRQPSTQYPVPQTPRMPSPSPVHSVSAIPNFHQQFSMPASSISPPISPSSEPRFVLPSSTPIPSQPHQAAVSSGSIQPQPQPAILQPFSPVPATINMSPQPTQNGNGQTPLAGTGRNQGSAGAIQPIIPFPPIVLPPTQNPQPQLTQSQFTQVGINQPQLFVTPSVTNPADNFEFVNGQAANTSLEVLGCAYDFLTNQCTDVFNLKWCRNCHNFGNALLPDCKCVLSSIPRPPSRVTFL
ncbi:hypothetical protein WR25_17518 [Diploscapter pachys]|uniref:Uncharacterized protein n=1 Tax=Diploscapter pachys TaxID=2018661 RepID=A0A2A2L6V8_9BILA|nr:hypothetical protein WR25_17518 [Diploscapter pachys]